VRITLNGEITVVEEGTSVSEIVGGFVEDTSATAVALNGEVVPRSTWDETCPGEGDDLEVVTAAPGG
jgi:sulfur carrier protein